MDGIKGFDKRRITAGTFLFKQDDIATSAYLLQLGKVRVTRTTDGQETELAIIEPGEVVGEMALLMKIRHSATAEVIEDSTIITLDSDLLGVKYLTSDPIMKKIIFCLVNRLYKANEENLRHRAIQSEIEEND